MKKKLYLLLVIAPLAMLLSSCGRDGDILVKPIKMIRKMDMQGFVLGDTLYQYFDGVKVRELYHRVNLDMELAFNSDETKMELRSKHTGKVLMTQILKSSDEKSVVPKFYYDGVKYTNTYTPPTPVEGKYTASFFLDMPEGGENMDVKVEMIEYYYDSQRPPYVFVVASTTTEIVKDVKPRTWSAAGEIILPKAERTRTDTELFPVVTLWKAGKAEYYNKNRDASTINMELPYEGSTETKVQSMYLGVSKLGNAVSLSPQENLVTIFP